MGPEPPKPHAPPDLLGDGDPLGFWARLARAPRRLLGLDYDGTLAPFRINRLEAVPAPGARQAIEGLLQDPRNAVAVISGRRVQEVRQLLGPLPLPLIGSHGYERLHPDGRLELTSLSAAQHAHLKRATLAAQDRGLGDRLERKAASLALHTRGLAPARAAGLERDVVVLWSEGCAEAGLRCLGFDGGVELRAEGVDKGTVLEQLLVSQAGALAVYIGDDRTDEDAFRVLRRHDGVGIKVGRRGLDRTAASGRLEGCDAVVRFLQKWRAV